MLKSSFAPIFFSWEVNFRLKLVVCIKSVPDTASSIRIKPDSPSVDGEGLTFVMNPYDEYAVEEALRIKEKQASAEITAISLGGIVAKEALRTALSMGVDQAIHLTDPSFDELDSQGIARILAKAVSRLGFDLILCGKQAVDLDSAQVGPALAEILDLPQIGVVTKLEFDGQGRHLRGHRQIEGGTEIVECPIPCVITAQKGLNEPRYPSLKGILMAKKREIPEWNGSQLKLGEEEAAGGPGKVNIISLKNPPLRSPGRILQGDSEQKVKELVQLLREEAKVF
jgi:electron transfer flavoprotein beta subunit